MHLGHIGFLQTMHSLVTDSPGCLRQTCWPVIGAGADSVAAGADLAIAMRGAAAEGTGTGAGAGGGADGVTETTVATGCGRAVAIPMAAASARICSFTEADESIPHEGQTNWTGRWIISGVTSTANFAPQLQMIFIENQGFSRTT